MRCEEIRNDENGHNANGKPIHIYLFNWFAAEAPIFKLNFGSGHKSIWSAVIEVGMNVTEAKNETEKSSQENRKTKNPHFLRSMFFVVFVCYKFFIGSCAHGSYRFPAVVKFHNALFCRMVCRA